MKAFIKCLGIAALLMFAGGRERRNTPVRNDFAGGGQSRNARHAGVQAICGVSLER